MTFEDLPPVCARDERTGGYWSPFWRAVGIVVTELNTMHEAHDVRAVPSTASMAPDLHAFLTDRAERHAKETGDAEELAWARACLACEVSDALSGEAYTRPATFVDSSLEPVREWVMFVGWEDLPVVHENHPLPGTPEHLELYGCY